MTKSHEYLLSQVDKMADKVLGWAEKDAQEWLSEPVHKAFKKVSLYVEVYSDAEGFNTATVLLFPSNPDKESLLHSLRNVYETDERLKDSKELRLKYILVATQPPQKSSEGAKWERIEVRQYQVLYTTDFCLGDGPTSDYLSAKEAYGEAD